LTAVFRERCGGGQAKRGGNDCVDLHWSSP
jgi:hypothetical protein